MTGIMQMFVGAKPGVVTGQQAYTSVGSYSWVAPTGVTSVSVVVVGGGASGGGGLRYGNNYSVTPGNSYTVVVGVGVYSGSSNDSSFDSTIIAKSSLGNTGGGSGSGGTAGFSGGSASFGGGGAAGYSGNGGNGGSSTTSGNSGSGGGGGGGYGGAYCGCPSFTLPWGGGGGVGILGAGASGCGGTQFNGYVGRGGSGGTNGSASCGGNAGNCLQNKGGLYGGGASSGSSSSPRKVTQGAVRIIWPGTTRSFPSTNTGDL